jgi:PAS domain S-box-containing protein
MPVKTTEPEHTFLSATSIHLPPDGHAHNELGKAVLDAIPDGVIIINQQGDVVYLNSQFSQLSGFSSADLVGAQVERVIPARFHLHKAHRESFVGNPHARPMGEGLVLWLQHKEGREIPVEISLSPLPTNQALFIAAFVRDVTVRRQMEMALWESEQLLRCYFDAGLVGMLISTPRRELIEFNDRFCEITGYSRAELPAIGWERLVHPEDHEHANETYLRMLQGRLDSIKREARYIRKDGSTIHVLVMTVCEHDKTGSLKHFVTIVDDITQSKETAKELTRYRENLEQEVHTRTQALMLVNQRLQEFVSTISHDLKAPLRSMEGFAQMFMEDYGHLLDERACYLLEHISDGAIRMNRMIDNLLQHARAQNRREFLERVNLDEVVASAIRNLSSDIIHRNAEIRVEGALPEVFGDRTMLEALVLNLVQNAIKFMPPYRQPVVTISASQTDKEYCVAIADNGIGIAEQDRQRIFEAFKRLQCNEEFAGAGLGLSIAKRAAELHRGKLWVESDVQTGSTFYFTIAKDLAPE